MIAALIGAAAGGGGVRAIARFFGPERDEAIADYYRGVIRDLRKEMKAKNRAIVDLQDRVEALELAQDHPPGHLG